ncbi:hypothetical protein D9756_006358 [Leucocoprinus leucothites]|uniref:CNH domain-containing protein n=1 Tax=Leucocoprinus leucothites TaxID=201217 RepID=A0A8H5G273_9AGAR|nr:hypothetical protein D9756_006358 [Leucoagaricus leucothites]
MSTSTNPLDIPPFQVQPLIPGVVIEDKGDSTRNASSTTPSPPRITCAQALASEIYVGCSNGELIRYALQADDPEVLESYMILSRQSLPNEKPIDNIIILPSLSRLLVQSGTYFLGTLSSGNLSRILDTLDRQIHFYMLPSLDPLTTIKPVRNVVTFAVDHRHLQRPAVVVNEPVEFSVIKRTGIAMFLIRNDRLFYQKEIPLPANSPPALLAKRVGHALCYADNEYYNMVDLEQASLYQLLPLRQVVEETPWEVKPVIEVIGENEFLILSWTGASALGVFITGDGDPVRGLDYPYVTSLLPNETIEVHSVETQSIVQVVPPPAAANSRARLGLVASLQGYLVPSTNSSGKMRRVKVGLVRKSVEVET